MTWKEQLLKNLAGVFSRQQPEDETEAETTWI